MKTFLLLGSALCICLGLWAQQAETVPSAGADKKAEAPACDMPAPQKEHEWLHQLVGEWDTETQILMEPNKPMKTKGTESGRKVGGFWVVLENKGDMMGTPFTGVMTLGYDTARKSYVGTWVDSMTSTLWHYQGSVDVSGRILTLTAEGPCPMQPGKIFKFRETIEIKGKDEKSFISEIEVDGAWQKILAVKYTRKK